eukprot:UN13629
MEYARSKGDKTEVQRLEGELIYSNFDINEKRLPENVKTSNSKDHTESKRIPGLLLEKSIYKEPEKNEDDRTLEVEGVHSKECSKSESVEESNMKSPDFKEPPSNIKLNENEDDMKVEDKP